MDPIAEQALRSRRSRKAGDDRSSAVAVVEPVEAPPPEPEGPVPARRFTDTAAPCATRLGGLAIRGILTGSDSVELSGTFEGPIAVDGFCRVNEGGRVKGDLTAGRRRDRGRDPGTPHRHRPAGDVGARARVLADVEAGTVAIAEGCFIEGRIHMRGSEGGSQPTTFKEKRRRRKRHHAAKGPKAPDGA